MLDIEQCWKFNKNDVIVIGCSTGPDSMALVDMLLKIRKKYNLSLVVAHVNHNLREESAEEAVFMKDYCEKNDILFETMTIEEYGDDNFHNEARNIRYYFFDIIVKKYSANYLMTAHHGDDLMETILMRVVRGSNLSGYSGFKKVVQMDGYQLVRPLIGYTKDELEKYDIENGVKYYIDKSNLKDKYTRNRYRKYVLPFLKQEDPMVHRKFLKFSDSLNKAASFIETERDKAIDRVLKDGNIIISKFVLEDPFIQQEILYYFLNEFYQDDLLLLNDRHISLIISLINSERVNSFINLPNDVIANKSYDVLELKMTTEEITGYEIEFNGYVSLPNSHIIEQIEEIASNSNDVIRLDSNEISLPLIVRTRRIGDKIYLKGMSGSRKVKDIFIDKKVRLSDRDSWPVVVDSKGRIVWLPGLKKSKYDKPRSEQHDIVLHYK